MDATPWHHGTGACRSTQHRPDPLSAGTYRPERGPSAGCWASAPVPGSVCREATEFSVRRSCPPVVSVCTPRIFRSSETPVVVRGLQRAHSPHPNTLLFRALSNTVSGLPRQPGPTHGDETDGGSESRSPVSPANRCGGCPGDKHALMQDAQMP